MASAPMGGGGGGISPWQFLIPILSGILGGSSTTNQSGSSNQTGSGYASGSQTGLSNTSFGQLSDLLANFSSATAPTVTPQYQDVGNLLHDVALQRLRQPTALPAGYEATQIQNINKGYDAAKAQQAQSLAESGLAGSPAEAALGEKIDTGRVGDINSLRANLPLLERQLRNQDVGLAQGILGQFGRGESTSGSQSQRSNTSGFSNTLSSAIFNQLFGNQQQGTNQTQTRQSSGLCCWIFLEAEDGKLPSEVRWYRDAHVGQRNLRGYYKTAEVLVPLMRKYWLIKQAVRWTMTKPLAAYAQWYYRSGRSRRIGWVFTPLARIWLGLWDYLGHDHPFRRENGEVV